MAKPKLIMMDEPSSGAAPIIVRGIFEIIREINRQGITVLLIEQNANMALKIADWAYVMRDRVHSHAGVPAKNCAANEGGQSRISRNRKVILPLVRCHGLPGFLTSAADGA